MSEAIWEEALAAVPDAEIATIVNKLKLRINGFTSPLNARTVSRMRKVIEAQLRDQRRRYDIQRKIRTMMDRDERLAQAASLEPDELWSRIHENGEYLWLWCLLADGRDEALDKAQQVLVRMTSISADGKAPSSDSAESDSNGDLEARLNALQRELDEVRNELKKAKRDAKAQLEKAVRALDEVRRERNNYRQVAREHEKRVRELEQANQARDAQVRELEAKVEAHQSRERQLAEDLKAKDDIIAGLEAELRDKVSALADLERAQEALRAALEAARSEAAPTRWSAPVAEKRMRVAVLGPPRPVASPSPRLDVHTYPVEQIPEFLNDVEQGPWDFVCVLRSLVTPRTVRAVCDRIPGHSVKVFESMTEVRDYLNSL